MDRILERLRRVKVFTLAQLMLWLSCSVPTARRRLKEWRAISSYNCNGKYYTLPGVARFDDVGLWRCGEAAFSSHGNLRKTVIALIHTSKAGLTGEELGALLGMEPRSFLAPFRHEEELLRKKQGKTPYVWFSAHPATFEKQLRARNCPAIPALTDAEAVVVLVEFIKRPASSFASLHRQVRPKLTTISEAAIRKMFKTHGLSIAQKKGSHSKR